MQINGHAIKAEMSMGSDKKSQISTFKVLLTNLSTDTTKEDLDNLITEVPTSEISMNQENATASLTYQTKEEAEK